VNHRARYLVLACCLALLVGCEPEIDLADDLTKGWAGHAWGTDRDQLVDDLGLQNAEANTYQGVTFIKTGKVRQLGEASVRVQLAFANDQLVGLSLHSLPDSRTDDAIAALNTRFGQPASDNVWQKDPITAKLVAEDNIFVITLLDMTRFRRDLSDELQKTRDQIDNARTRIQEQQATPDDATTPDTR